MKPKDTSPLADIPATGALPAYLRIAELVSRQIDAGILADGHRLPPEREMADAYGVSVGTLRKALARLTEMGCLERRQGSGNYIRQTDRSAAIYTMFRLERPDGGGLGAAAQGFPSFKPVDRVRHGAVVGGDVRGRGAGLIGKHGDRMAGVMEGAGQAAHIDFDAAKCGRKTLGQDKDHARGQFQ